MNDSEAVAELKHFFFSHFHEDWVDYADSAEAVVQRFLTTKPDADQLRLLVRGIEATIEAHANDRDLKAALRSQLWCNYAPEADGKTVRGWLESLKAIFSKEAEGPE